MYLDSGKEYRESKGTVTPEKKKNKNAGRPIIDIMIEQL